jgi:hypothetical protein
LVQKTDFNISGDCFSNEDIDAIFATISAITDKSIDKSMFTADLQEWCRNYGNLSTEQKLLQKERLKKRHRFIKALNTVNFCLNDLEKADDLEWLISLFRYGNMGAFASYRQETNRSVGYADAIAGLRALRETVAGQVKAGAPKKDRKREAIRMLALHFMFKTQSNPSVHGKTMGQRKGPWIDFAREVTKRAWGPGEIASPGMLDTVGAETWQDIITAVAELRHVK